MCTIQIHWIELKLAQQWIFSSILELKFKTLVIKPTPCPLCPLLLTTTRSHLIPISILIALNNKHFNKAALQKSRSPMKRPEVTLVWKNFLRWEGDLETPDLQIRLEIITVYMYRRVDSTGCTGWSVGPGIGKRQFLWWTSRWECLLKHWPVWFGEKVPMPCESIHCGISWAKNSKHDRTNPLWVMPYRSRCRQPIRAHCFGVMLVNHDRFSFEQYDLTHSVAK